MILCDPEFYKVNVTDTILITFILKEYSEDRIPVRMNYSFKIPNDKNLVVETLSSMIIYEDLQTTDQSAKWFKIHTNSLLMTVGGKYPIPAVVTKKQGTDTLCTETEVYFYLLGESKGFRVFHEALLTLK